MRKIAFYLLGFSIVSMLFSGCANTAKRIGSSIGSIGGIGKGIGADTQHNWQTIKRWDQNFRNNWW